MMKLRGIRDKLTDEEVERYEFIQGYDFAVSTGKEYLAYSLYFVIGNPWVLINSGLDYLLPIPLVLFEVIDARLSQYWEFMEQGEVYFFSPPEFAKEENFVEKLAFKEEGAVAAFQKLKPLLEEEAGMIS